MIDVSLVLVEEEKEKGAVSLFYYLLAFVAALVFLAEFSLLETDLVLIFLGLFSLSFFQYWPTGVWSASARKDKGFGVLDTLEIDHFLERLKLI